MTARTEIEHRHLYYKRRHSLHSTPRDDQYKTRCASSADVDDSSSMRYRDEEDYIRSSEEPTGRRIKSTSVCVATLQMEGEKRLPRPPPRTMNDFQFLSPEVLTVQNYEIQTIRPPALSTSEVFNELPPLYIYRAVPPHERVMYSKKSTKTNKVIEFARRRKHTLIAWSFGSVAVLVCLIVVILQTRGDFKH